MRPCYPLHGARVRDRPELQRALEGPETISDLGAGVPTGTFTVFPGCVVAGLGLAGLPCFLADPLLERLTEPLPATDIWVLVHPDLRRSPRLRLFRDAMAEALERHRPRLEGHA